jgi:CheY-like chemotaxis protein
MTALLVVVMFLCFVALDALVRIVARRMQAARTRKEREAVLETAVRLEFADEARSLKRVEVHEPRARILAVDDEPVVLDSFRRILVLDGFSVDTVESGPEALGLLRRRNYDFLFTDLKMPDMDGVEVVKAAKHLRPDVDVAVITGFATIESAVATMQSGASDYVQKPFTPDELSQFAAKLLVKRQERLERERRPTVRLVAPAAAATVASHEFCVPGGAFLSEGHAWVRIEPNGQARVGLDDFARKALGAIDRFDLPNRGDTIHRDAPLFAVWHERMRARFGAPLTGRVVQVNAGLSERPSRATESPYEEGWVCVLQPTDLASELPALRIGKPVIDWYQEEIARLGKEGSPREDWSWLERTFLARSTQALVKSDR